MKVLILIIRNKRKSNEVSFDYELNELKNLFLTYNSSASFIHTIIRIDEINPSFFIGKGKVEEIKEKIKYDKIDIVLTDITLSPTQQKNLMDLWNIKVIDKTYLILEIFNQRARSNEGKLQVELARLKYELSRLTGKGISMDQQYGAVGVRGGSGEKKIEYERRAIKDKISLLTKKIEEIKKNRENQRKKRLDIPLPVISIVGYTNSGKSTLLNTLSKKNDVYADNKLFATLDPTSRRVHIKNGFFAIFTDTVGFINNLPHLLIHAFSATLEEIKYSDIIVHLHDATSDIEKQNMVVKKTLKEIEADKIPVINVFNKIDLLNQNEIEYLKIKFSNLNPLFISAKEKLYIDELLKEVDKLLSLKWKTWKIKLDYLNSDKISYIKHQYFITKEKYLKDKIIFEIRTTEENFSALNNLIKNSLK